MATKLTNVRVQYIRPQYNNLKDWCQDTNNVYIGRGRIVIIDGVRYPPQDSKFANPFKAKNIGKDCDIIEMYKDYICQEIEDGRITVDELQALKGKTLGCWCWPNPCHGDIILQILEVLDDYKKLIGV